MPNPTNRNPLPTPTATPYPPDLTPNWCAYLADRAVNPEAAMARGYRSVLMGKPLDGGYASAWGFPQAASGMLIPLHPVRGGHAYQLRLDADDGAKFRVPPRQANTLATSPLTAHMLDQPNTAIIVAEGVTRVDALAGFGIPALGILGASSWRGKLTALPDWDDVAIRGNRFLLAVDGDVTSNRAVHTATGRLARFLIGRHADTVTVAMLPDGLGLDDWIASSGFDDAEELMKELMSMSGPFGAVPQPPRRTPTATESGCCPPWLAPDMPALLTLTGDDALNPDADARRLLRQHGPDTMVVIPKDGGRADALYGLSASGLWLGFGPLVEGLERQAREAFNHVKDHIRPGDAWPAQPLRYFGKTVRNAEARDRALASIPAVAPAAFGAVVVDDTDTNGRYLGCSNGVVDLATGALLPPDVGRTHAVTRSTALEYRPKAEHPYVDRLFENLPADVAAYLVAVLGRAMWGLPEDVSVILLGAARAGKSTLLKAVWSALGDDYYGTAPADVFDRTARPGRSQHTEDRMGFYGPRVCAIVEAEGRGVDAALFKATTGGDTQSTRRIHQSQASKTPTATLFWCANRMPLLDMSDPATRERVAIVDYSQTIPAGTRDPAIRDAFAQRDPDASGAMLALLVASASANPPGTRIPVPDAVTHAIDREAEASSTQLTMFLQSATASDRNGKLPVDSLWDEWGAWCAEREIEEGGGFHRDDRSSGNGTRNFSRAVGQEFAQYGWPVGKCQALRPSPGMAKVKGWRGVRLASQAHTPEMEIPATEPENPNTVPPRPSYHERCGQHYDGAFSEHMHQCEKRHAKGEGG